MMILGEINKINNQNSRGTRVVTHYIIKERLFKLFFRDEKSLKKQLKIFL